MKKLLLALLITLGLQAQAQTIDCNTLGLGYITTQNANYPLTVHASVMPYVFTQSDSIYYNWTICVGDSCYSSQNMSYTLGYWQMQLTDTVSVCYNAHTISNALWQHCSSCDSLIFNGTEWVILNVGNPTSINELTTETINDNKIYDMLGRELVEAKVGQMYIKNGKKYIIR